LQEDERGTTNTLRSLLSALALVLFPVYVLMIVLAPALVEALGPRWAGTAPLIQIIALAAVSGVYADSVLPLLMGRGRPDHAMMVSGIQTGVLLLALVPLVSLFGVAGAAAAWLPAYAAAQVLSFVLVGRAISRPLAGAQQALLALLMVALFGGVVAATVRVWLQGFGALAGGVLLGGAIAVVLLRVLSRHMDLGLRELLGTRAAQAVF
jgi:O-antigen/teichoic acid export membrane protein